ncbi:MAG TPA: glycosyltransferase family 4 protein, partial [Chthoniobacteraceae bacterium]|nr:glycosyltransferase family 4 protein [Chthoniobacteraceae bacterium]
MKILLSSHFFHPSVGGIEQVSLTLAREFVKAGHEVKVVTTTERESGEEFPFEVARRPGSGKLCALVGWCDVFFHNNISLQTAWPLVFTRRPWVVAHHTWLTRINGATGIRDRIKQRVIRRATNIAVSRAVAEHLSMPSTVIGNPYNDALFKTNGAGARTGDLVFVGRLVWDKGVDLLISAVSALKNRDVQARLTVVGDGPEREMLERQVMALELKDRVEFAGMRTGEELVALLNAHRVMVVPSRWKEPSGL